MVKTISALLVVLSLAVGAGQAEADGGASIETAPIVAYGQTQTGETGSGLETGTILQSFWKLRVRSGDTITIDWEARRGTHIEIFPAGTSDYTFPNATSLHKQGIGPTERNEVKFVAPRVGMMPLVLKADTVYAGPYAFTARVRHWHPRHHG